jgi:hypothetical protein
MPSSRLTNAGCFLLNIQQPTLRLRELATPRPAEWESRLVGELFLDFEYLCEFEAKIGTARNVVYGTNAEPIYA